MSHNWREIETKIVSKKPGPVHDSSEKRVFSTVLIHHFILVFLVLVTISCLAFSIKAENLIYFSSSLLVASFAWCFWSWFHVTGSIFDPYVLFMVSIFLFNGSAAFLYIFNYPYRDSLGVNFTDTVLLESLLFVILSVMAVNYGSLLAAQRKFERSTNTASIIDKHNMAEAVYRVGVAMLLLSFIPTIVFMRENILTVLESGYGGIFTKESATGFGAWSNVLSGFYIPGVYFLLLGGKDKRHVRAISILLISIYAIAYLYIGSRNRAILPIIVFLWLWNKYISRFRLINVIVIILLLTVLFFFAFPLIRLIRAVPGEERTAYDYLQTLKELKNPIVSPFAEMGGSFRTVTYTFSLVPSDRNYDYGASYIYALFTIVPNFAWDIHPTIARGTWSDWLVKRVSPYTAEKGGGYGFSCIAEAYANFGWFSFLLFLFLGYYIAKLALSAMNAENPAKVALLASFLPQLLFFARSESAILVRQIVWYALLPYLFAVVLYKRKEQLNRSFRINRVTSHPSSSVRSQMIFEKVIEQQG